ncbi:unnamed protein product [Haemonchus placei]|uniref:Uncharacterized protein n=1 Tax=Haemonchus placei TaxID=6290 RepID=A0A158QMP9_HAEPC|nr:unnamed protein product [Haemonchus placei]
MMYVMLILLSVLTVGLAVQPSAAQLPVNHAYKDGNTLRIPIDANASEELFDKWLSQALSGLMAAVTSGRLDQLDEDDREEIHRCSKMAYTVPDHARCVVKVLDTTRHIKRIPTNVKRIPTKVVKSKRISPVKRKPIKRKIKEFIPKQNDEWVGGFRLARAKRSVQLVNRTSYNLTSIDDETFFSKVVRQTAKTIRKFKNKTDGTQSWRSAIQRIKHIGKEARMMAKQRKALKKRLRQMIDNTPDDFQDPRKAAAIRQMEMEDEDLAMKKKIGMEKKEEIRVPMKLVRESIKIALAATGKNVSNFDDKTLKLLSPRFLSIVPEEDPDDLVSSEVERTLSLPNLVKALPNKDQEAWLDFIVEAAGVSDAIDMTEKKQQQMREEGSRGPDGTPLYFTKKNVTDIFGDTERRKIETFEELDRLYTKSQREDLDKQGYSYLTLKQLDVIYGPNSPYNKSDSHRLFRKLRRLHDDPHHLIEHDIRALAEAKKFRVRQKDIALSPFVLTPLTGAGAALSTTVVLSPLVLSPITLSPAVLGPIILSPWVFVPLILSPRVLSPLIVNPLIFSPIILSPLVLHPLILVPGVFNPVILSPLVLSPLILSPQVFTPIVLSPLLLSPLIYNPMAGSPLVLSPFLLSPIICSPQYLFAVVLSPYALSPLIQSKLIASEVILSPNWLS